MTIDDEQLGRLDDLLAVHVAALEWRGDGWYCPKRDAKIYDMRSDWRPTQLHSQCYMLVEIMTGDEWVMVTRSDGKYSSVSLQKDILRVQAIEEREPVARCIAIARAVGIDDMAWKSDDWK